MSLDYDTAVAFIESIPVARWMTYGDVADAAGNRDAARSIGGWLLESCGSIPFYWRVIDSNGEVASAHEISELRLGKKTEELYVEAEELHKQVTPHSYGDPPIRFTEEDVDQARAAGVLIEFERGRRDHRRPSALPGARQERGEANRRAAARKGR